MFRNNKISITASKNKKLFTKSFSLFNTLNATC